MTGYLLYERCRVTSEANGGVDVYHKLHGDVPGDWCTTELPVNQRSTDKGHLPTTKTANTIVI